MNPESRITELVLDLQERRARGERVNPADLDPEVRRRLEALDRVGRFLDLADVPATHTGSPAAEDTAPPDAPQTLSLPGHDVLGVLGAGGMGVVYQARETSPLGRLVAVKMIRRGDADEADLARFRAEARAVADLRHPHVVAIHAWGEHAARPYFIMEFVEGGSLEKRLAGAPQPPRDAARLLLLLARVMHAAHTKGILHRDLKPANVLLAPAEGEPALNSPYGCPKVTDFGLVKRLGGDQALSAAGALLGTASYMAPEQASGRSAEVGPATDVYALGAILYEMLTGRPPFKGDSFLATLEQVRSRPPEPPGRLRGDVPRDLEAICLKCLAKSPRDRHASAADLADDLSRFLGGSTPSAERPTLPPRGATPPQRSRRRWWIAGACGVAVAIAVWAVVTSGSREPEPPPDKKGPELIGRQEAPERKGFIDVLIYDPTDARQQRLRLSHAAALPLKAGDEFSIDAELDRPAYVYVLWIDTDGKVHPVYPWRPGKWDARPETETPVQRLRRPEVPDEFYPMAKGAAGMDTLVLLARATPLPRDVDLRAEFGKLPTQDEKDMRAAVWFENGEVVRGERLREPRWEPRRVNDPVLEAQRRVREVQRRHFDYSRAVSFANQGK